MTAAGFRRARALPFLGQGHAVGFLAFVGFFGMAGMMLEYNQN